MEKEIKTIVIGDENELKELDIETKIKILHDSFIELGFEVLGLSFHEMGQVVKSMHDSHKFVGSLKDSDLDKIIKEVFDHEIKQGKH